MTGLMRSELLVEVERLPGRDLDLVQGGISKIKEIFKGLANQQVQGIESCFRSI